MDKWRIEGGGGSRQAALPQRGTLSANSFLYCLYYDESLETDRVYQPASIRRCEHVCRGPTYCAFTVSLFSLIARLSLYVIIDP